MAARRRRHSAVGAPPPRAQRAPVRSSGPIVPAVAVGALSFVVYAAMAARDIVPGDTPELISAAAVLGVAHPPGYPVFTILGHVFSLLPVGPIPFRVDLLSAVAHALTVTTVFLVARRASRDLAGSLLAAATLATVPLFWTASLIAEVFPLSDLLAIATLGLTLRWEDDPDRPFPLVGAALMFGLGLADHLTISLIVPAILLTLWRRRAVLLARPGIVVAGAGAIAAGLVPYVYLPIAAATHPPVNWGGVSSASDLAAHLLRQQYGTLQLVGGSETGGSLAARFGLYLASFSVVEGLLLVVGAVGAYRAARARLWSFVAAFAFSGPLFVAYANANVESAVGRYIIERFFLMGHVAAVPLVAFVPAAVLPIVPRSSAYLARTALLGAAALGLVATAAPIVGAIDRRDDHVTRVFAEDLLATIEPESIFLARGDAVVFPLEYLQIVEGARRDVTVVSLALVRTEWYVREIRERDPRLVVPFAAWDGSPAALKALADANAQRQIFVQGEVRPDENVTFGLDIGYDYEPHGLLLRLVPRGTVLDPATVVAEYERLFAGYRPPSGRQVAARAWEPLYVSEYALFGYRMGRLFENAQRYAEARRWYERALAIRPGMPEATRGLARLPT